MIHENLVEMNLVDLYTNIITRKSSCVNTKISKRLTRMKHEDLEEILCPYEEKKNPET